MYTGFAFSFFFKGEKLIVILPARFVLLDSPSLAKHFCGSLSGGSLL